MRPIVRFALAILAVVLIVIVLRDCTPPPRRAMRVSTVTTAPTLPSTSSTTWEPATTTTVATLPTTTTTTASPPPAPDSSPGPAEGSSEVFLACVLDRESEGQFGAVSPTGEWRGGFQFAQPTWDNTARHAGRPDLVGIDPAAASPADQWAMARALVAWQGRGPWAGGRWPC